MTKTIHRTALVAAGLALAAAGASAQHVGTPQWAQQQAAAAKVDPNVAVATYTGTFVLNFTISIKSSIPASYPIQCSASFMPTDIGSGYFFNEEKTVLAIHSGSTGSCSITVPYSWVLSSSTAPVSTTYTVSTSGTGSSLVNRISTGSLASVPLPANTTTLTRTVAVTI